MYEEELKEWRKPQRKTVLTHQGSSLLLLDLIWRTIIIILYGVFTIWHRRNTTHTRELKSVAWTPLLALVKWESLQPHSNFLVLEYLTSDWVCNKIPKPNMEQRLNRFMTSFHLWIRLPCCNWACWFVPYHQFWLFRKIVWVYTSCFLLHFYLVK